MSHHYGVMTFGAAVSIVEEVLSKMLQTTVDMDDSRTTFKLLSFSQKMK